MTGTGLAIAATDLFVSATAALLVVLAIMRPVPPVELPIQSDLVAHCTMDASSMPVTLEISVPGNAGDVTPFQVSDPSQMAQVPGALGLPPRLFYMIALSPNGQGKLLSDCVAWARDTLVREHNAGMFQPGPANNATPTRAIFTLAIAAQTGAQAP